MTALILPCPFCGVPPVLELKPLTPFGVRSLGCMNDACGVNVFVNIKEADESGEEAINAWNYQVGSSARNDVLARLTYDSQCLQRLIKLNPVALANMRADTDMVASIVPGTSVPEGILNDAKYLLKELATPHPDRVYRSALRISDYLKSLPGKKS